MRLAGKLPEVLKEPLRHARDAIVYYGNKRICPVCERSSRRFRQFGSPPRTDAQCIHCGALERTRLLWLFLLGATDLFDGRSKSVLHVAPLQCIETRLREALNEGYLTADLFNPRAMVEMDIANIQYASKSFDVVLCSHVLEHVDDDRKAMREFYRVLSDHGWMVLLVPITVEVTYEDPTIVDPEGRLKAFGQVDHVRRYGRDFGDRLVEAGFRVRIVEVGDMVSEDAAIKMGLTRFAGEIYYCTKE